MIRKLSLLLLSWAALAIPVAACAQVATLPVVRGPGGQAVPAQAHICVDLTGAYVGCGSGGGGGGGSSLVAAYASAPTWTNGSTANQMAGNTHGALFFVPTVPSTGAQIDLSTPSVVAGVDGSTAASNANPFPISDGGGSLTIDATALPLPTGAATSAKQASLDTAGAFIIPQGSSANSVITKTTLVANTSTTVCPTATNPVTTEIWFKDATAIGVGLKAQALSTDAWGTGATTADLVFSTAGTLYTLPVALSTAVTARSAGTPSVTCIQNLRQ